MLTYVSKTVKNLNSVIEFLGEVIFSDPELPPDFIFGNDDVDFVPNIEVMKVWFYILLACFLLSSITCFSHVLVHFFLLFFLTRSLPCSVLFFLHCFFYSSLQLAQSLHSSWIFNVSFISHPFFPSFFDWTFLSLFFFSSFFPLFTRFSFCSHFLLNQSSFSLFLFSSFLFFCFSFFHSFLFLFGQPGFYYYYFLFQSLLEWDHNNSESLVILIKELVQQYKQYQIGVVKTIPRMQIECEYLTGNTEFAHYELIFRSYQACMKNINLCHSRLN